ncbi:hypothetical protein Trydic_g13303 [Trypoxylus dichotomus]
MHLHKSIRIALNFPFAIASPLLALVKCMHRDVTLMLDFTDFTVKVKVLRAISAATYTYVNVSRKVFVITDVDVNNPRKHVLTTVRTCSPGVPLARERIADAAAATAAKPCDS